MAALVCERFVSGPNCSDNRKETTAAEKDDCFIEATYKMRADFLNCKATKVRGLRSINVEGLDCPVSGCLDELSCLNNSYWRDYLAKCYCTSGLTCTVCEAERNGAGGYSQHDEATPASQVESVTNYTKRLATSITSSAYDIPIPLAYGTVILAGNIIWAGNYLFTTRVERSTATGNEVEVTTTQEGSLDLLLGFTASEVARIRRIWFDAQLIYSVADDNTVARSGLSEAYDNMKVSLLSGIEGKKVLNKLSAVDGLGRSPAYRGLTCVLFETYPLRVDTTNLPMIRVEFAVSASDTPASSTTSALAYSLEPDTLAVDHTGGRFVVSAGDGDLRILDAATLLEVDTIAVDGTYAEGTAIYLDSGDLLYQTIDGKIHYQASNRLLTFSAPSVGVGKLGAVRILTTTRESFYSITLAYQKSLYVYKLDVPGRDITLEYSHVDVGFVNFSHLIVGDMGGFAPNNTSHVINYAIGFDYTPDNIELCKIELTTYLHNYLPSDLYVQRFYSASWHPEYTYLVQSLRDVVLYKDNVNANNLLFFVQDTSGFYSFSAKTHPVTIQDINWYATLEMLPASNTSRNPIGPRRGDFYFYIGSDNDSIYRVELASGVTTFLYTLTDNSAPMLDGAYTFDSASNSITYIDEDGQLTRVYLNAVAASKASIADIARDLTTRAGAPAYSVQASPVEAVTVDGFLVVEQSPIFNRLQELSDFLQLSIQESNGVISINSLATTSNFTLSTDETLLDQFSRATDLIEIDSASVGYLASQRNGEEATQYASRDFFTDYDDYTTNVGSVSLTTNIYATADDARVSAERLLLKALEREDSRAVRVGPKRLAVEPGDYVDSVYRIIKTSMDVTFETILEAKKDDAGIYQFQSDISGYETAFVDVVAFDPVGVVKEFPYVVSGPPLEYNPIGDSVYLSLFNPDGDSFTPAPIYYRGISSTFISAGTPTREALLGTLISIPYTNVAVFGTDKLSVLVVEFVRDVTVADFHTVTDDEEVYTDAKVNVLFVGNEVLQYKNFSIAIDNRTVTFTNLLRGRWGTDRHMDEHLVGEAVVVYNPLATLPVTLGNSITNNGVLVAATFNANYPSIRREVETGLTAHITDFWLPHDFKIRKVTTGPQPGVELRALAREPFADSVFRGDEGSMLYTTQYCQIAVAAITAPYDEDMVLAALKGDPYTDPYFKFFTLDASTNAEQFRGGDRWAQADFLAAGYTYTSDITFVYFAIDTSIGTYSKFKVMTFPGAWSYTKFTEGRDA